MTDQPAIELRVNGVACRVAAAPGRFLLDVLRDDLGLLGTKEACDEGECGACTVLLDGAAIDSCIWFAAAAEGHDVTTIEGLDGERDLQDAFVAAGAIQCGFCTPGFVTAAAALLAEKPAPSDEEIRDGLAGNLCRCTGYENIVAAVRAAATAKGAGRQ